MLGWDTLGDTPKIHVNFGSSREKPKCYLNQQVTCILEIYIYGIFILKIVSKYLPVG